jgi:flagellar biosynthesis protein FlhA
VAGILTVLGVLPGMPHLIILPAAALAASPPWRSQGQARRNRAGAVAEVNPNLIGWTKCRTRRPRPRTRYGLIGLSTSARGAADGPHHRHPPPALARARLRGPLVRVRDNLALGPNQYRIIVAGVIAAEDEIWPETCSRSTAATSCPRSPAGASRIRRSGSMPSGSRPRPAPRRSVAGYTVVDPATVVATHLNQIVQSAAADMFGMDEAQKLLDALKESAPQLVQGLTPNPLPLASIAALCRALLSEGVPLKDFRRIAEAMVDAAREEADPVQLVEGVRQRIGGLIVQTIAPARMPLPVLTLDTELENSAASGGAHRQGSASPDRARPRPAPGPGDRRRRRPAPRRSAQGGAGHLAGRPPRARPSSRPHMPDVPVLSFLEIPMASLSKSSPWSAAK